MKLNVLEGKLKKIGQKSAPDDLCLDVLKFAEKRTEIHSKAFKLRQITEIPFINRLILQVLGSIPFIELFWFINEIFVKKNNIKIKLH
ncbi:MAG: hypothetical protein PF574_04595 [Candidatus Delongbacteria bacterium]|jgi:hypothetical protein|nr:hypothetical protein [Candidatus Delongbacteria bacterium]